MPLDLVGPKGYEHGWKFVGVPGVTPHSELLKQRSQARAVHPVGHPERKKAENAVRQSRKMGMHTKAQPGQEAAPDLQARAQQMPVTPGEGPRHEAAAARKAHEATQARSIGDKAAARASHEAALKRSAKRQSGGVHPNELTVSAGRMMKGYTYPDSRSRRRGARPQEHTEIRSAVSHNGKVVGSYGTREYPGYGGNGPSYMALTESGGKGSDVVGSAPKGMSHEQAHAHFQSAVRNRVAADVNARRARSTLSAAGFNAVKSHGTSVRGWRNYDAGHQVSAGNTGVRIEHYTGSSLVQGGKVDRIEKNLEAYVARLEQRGFTVTQHYENGKLAFLTIDNEKQGTSKRVNLSAETPALVATPAPLGKPGGPGLYHLKGAKLPNYIENMRNALMRGGMSEGRATATAISRCKVLAATSKHPEVKAAAAAAIAELKATAARAKAVHGHANEPASVVELFNMMHAPPGSPAGGQFASKGGGASSSSGKAAKSKSKPPRFLPSGTNATAKAARKKQLLGRAKSMRARANVLEGQLHGLVGQLHALNAGKSSTKGGSKATGTTTKATKVKKAPKKAAATAKKTTAAKKSTAASQSAVLSVKITRLRVQIKTLRSNAAALVKRAHAL